MTKHRLMLSAAATALLAAACSVSAAYAQTEISTNTSTALATAANTNVTTASGNITIDYGASINTASTTPTVTLNSNNYVLNFGTIGNTNTTGAVGVLIDTTAGSFVSAAPTGLIPGLTSSGAINLGGGGTNKYGIEIAGGNSFYGNVTLNTATSNTSTVTASTLALQGDSSSAIYLVQGTNIAGNILLGGSGITQTASSSSASTNNAVIDLDGTLYGNFINLAPITGTGPNIIGIETLGGINSCANAPAAPSAYTCPTASSTSVGSGGSFVNSSNINLIGTANYSIHGGNTEANSAIIIAGSIAGGFLNNGPGTGSNLTAAVISSSGLLSSTSAAPVLVIDPSRSITTTRPVATAITIGQLTTDIDTIDEGPSSPGYSFINRGTISAQPLDPQLNTEAVAIQGVNSSINTTFTNGLLNTGTIAATATTNSQTITGTTATALYVGAFATIPSITVNSEVASGVNTPGRIIAQVTGDGSGSAIAVLIGQSANVATLTVGQNASILATVATTTTSPSASIAPLSSPFSLTSEAIVDLSGSVTTINNAGLIQATNTVLTPATGAYVSNIQQAINLSNNTTPGITINNSGRILGDVLFGSGGTGDTLYVGNTGTNGNSGTVANSMTGITNTSSNYAVLAETIVSQAAGAAPVTTAALLNFGSGTGQTLHVGGFGYVDADIRSAAGALAVQVDSNGILYVANTTQPVNASTFTIAANGTLGLAISQANVNSLIPVVQASGPATLEGAKLAVQFGTFVYSPTPAAPTAQTITLIQASTINDSPASLALQNAQVSQNTSFLFESPAANGGYTGEVPATASYAADNGPLPLTLANGNQTLLLTLLPRSVNATNADGSPGLNLSASAKSQFPFTAAALSTDDQLGAAVASSLTVYNTPGNPASGINVAASQQQAQKVFSQFAPDVSGGTREIAVLLTDQASGPVAARQRLLHDFANQPGDMTLWGEEFTGQINNKGRVSADGTLTAYKDHGFGFVMGLDGGSPRGGWYGGAFTFYSGDVDQLLPRATRTQTQWYMLTGYTDWHGKHAFFDTQLSAAYGNFTEDRTIQVGTISRDATSKRPAAMVAAGANLGVMLKYGGIEIDPHVSLDGLTLREDGYSEAGGGSGFNLQVGSYYASSLRTAFGADLKTSVNVWGIDLAPAAQLGYRYDLLRDAVKIKAAFESTAAPGQSALSTAGNTMTFVGPDPDSGNVVAGLGLGASTDTWQLGVNYNWIRGNNGSTTQVGILTVLGRI